jgi:hypothetical protein
VYWRKVVLMSFQVIGIVKRVAVRLIAEDVDVIIAGPK